MPLQSGEWPMAGNALARVYIFDTNVWVAIDGHPKSNRIPALLNRLLNDGRLKSPKPVFGELIRAGEYSEWAKDNRRKITYPSRMNPDYAANVGLVQMLFPGMGRALGSRERADPWVVAAALTEGAKGQDCCVVTTESLHRRPNRKIPGACKQLGIACITLNELLEAENEE